MMRALAIYLGLLVLGIILAVAGWVLTPGAASFAFPGPINVAGQSLIALGLTLIVVAIGLLLAGAEEPGEGEVVVAGGLGGGPRMGWRGADALVRCRAGGRCVLCHGPGPRQRAGEKQRQCRHQAGSRHL